MTNVLIEGGGELLGSFFDAGEIDEVHAFIAPKLIGGRSASSPIRGAGLAMIGSALQLTDVSIQQAGGDVYVAGRVRKAPS